MSFTPLKAGGIVTFYSYKGGAGRSMALANTAFLLGRRLIRQSQNVLVIDWDIEAPGLHRYFPCESPINDGTRGIVDYFCELEQSLDSRSYKKLSVNRDWRDLRKLLPLDQFIIPDVAEGVHFIKAGKFDEDYAERATSFDWVEFYNKYRIVFQMFREYLATLYPWCLIDSRTGLSDVSGICTMLMPEKLVAVFTPNRQSLEGVLDLVQKALKYRRESDDARPLAVFPLLSRLVTDEHELVKAARENARREFEKCFKEAHDLEDCNLAPYFDAMQIPHIGFYGFNERIPARDDPSVTHDLSMNQAYEKFYDRLIKLDHCWEDYEALVLEEAKAQFSKLDEPASRQQLIQLAQSLERKERRNSTLLRIRGFDGNGLASDQTVQATDAAHPECDLWVEPLPGAAAVQLLLRVGDSDVRVEIEADADDRIPLHVTWNEQRILRLSSESRTVLTLPADERYAGAPGLRRVQDSSKLDLFFLIDGTTKALSTPEAPKSEPLQGETQSKKLPPVFVPLLDQARSKTWGAFVEKLMVLVAEMGKPYSDMRTGVLAFGDHSMKFISSSPDLTCGYLLHPENSEERKLYSYTQDQLRQQMMRIPHTSGGDFVDALGEALEQCGHVGWRTEARKILVLCGDSPGFSLFKPAPPGADVHVRQVDVDREAAQLHARGVEIASVYLGTPASATKNPYLVSEPKAFLDHARGQYRRLASLPALFWDDSSFDPRVAAKSLKDVPPLIARGPCYGIVTVEPASRESRRSEVEQAVGRSAT